MLHLMIYGPVAELTWRSWVRKVSETGSFSVTWGPRLAEILSVVLLGFWSMAWPTIEKLTAGATKHLKGLPWRYRVYQKKK